MTKKSISLEVDPSIMEKNMKIIKENPVEEEFNKLLSSIEPLPSTLVKPSPGMCVKARTVDGRKVFVNVCTTEAIPAPPPLSNEELVRVLSSADPTSYRVPMSLGAPRAEPDRAGRAATVCDVAVNTDFFRTVQTDDLFRAFFLTVVLEGLHDKYQLDLHTDNYTVLKNRKCVGTLHHHRIEQREVSQGGGVGGARPLVQEVAVVEEARAFPWRVRREPRAGEIHRLVMELRVPPTVPLPALGVQLTADRVVVTAPSPQPPSDCFLPATVDVAAVTATLDRNTQILSINMPVLQ